MTICQSLAATCRRMYTYWSEMTVHPQLRSRRAQNQACPARPSWAMAGRAFPTSRRAPGCFCGSRRSGLLLHCQQSKSTRWEVLCQPTQGWLRANVYARFLKVELHHLDRCAAGDQFIACCSISIAGSVAGAQQMRSNVLQEGRPQTECSAPAGRGVPPQHVSPSMRCAARATPCFLPYLCGVSAGGEMNPVICTAGGGCAG